MEQVISGQYGQHNIISVYITWHYIFGFIWNLDMCYTIVSRHIMWEKAINNWKPNHYYLKSSKISKIKTKKPKVNWKILLMYMVVMSVQIANLKGFWTSKRMESFIVRWWQKGKCYHSDSGRRESEALKPKEKGKPACTIASMIAFICTKATCCSIDIISYSKVFH